MHERRSLAIRGGFACLLTLLVLAGGVSAAGIDEATAAKRLDGFDAYMQKLLKDWNVPGIGVGIVVKDKLVFAKGYGFRSEINVMMTETGPVITTTPRQTELLLLFPAKGN